ncbi:MAG: radical SAM protein [Dehalogenimonas sp.]
MSRMKSLSVRQSPRRFVEKCFLLEHQNLQLAYFPKRHQVLSLNQAAIPIIKALNGVGFTPSTSADRKFINSLSTASLLTSESIPESPDIQQSTDYRPTRAGLLLTDVCNLNCVYCYSHNNNAPQTMSETVARAAIDLIIKNASEDHSMAHLQFHGGGEPTCAWSMVQTTIEYFESKVKLEGVEKYIGITTNGVFSQQRMAWLAEHVDEFCISWDGTKEIHDRLRPKRNGQGSYDDVLRTFDYLDKIGKKYWISSTVTEDSLQYFPGIIDVLANRPGFEAISLEPIYQHGRGQELDVPDADRFLEAFRAVKKLGRDNGLRIEFSSARGGSIRKSYCYATDPAFNVTPTGMVTACYMRTDPHGPQAGLFFHGSYDHEAGHFIFNAETRALLRSRNIDNLSECRDCFCRYHCAGGCLNQSGAIDQVSPYRCYITKNLTLDHLVESLQ